MFIQPKGSEEKYEQIMPPKQVEGPTPVSPSESDAAVENPTASIRVYTKQSCCATTCTRARQAPA